MPWHFHILFLSQLQKWRTGEEHGDKRSKIDNELKGSFYINGAPNLFTSCFHMLTYVSSPTTEIEKKIKIRLVEFQYVIYT